MKKTYMTPALSEQHIMVEMLIAASITGVSGNSGIQMGDEDIPEEADVKDGYYFGESIFD
ncbi:MAG: hypothetical protein IJS59_02800 [Bacteroidaceae bacterium]|nr:hypothetical protein [Bacteroidaceae bacterium]